MRYGSLIGAIALMAASAAVPNAQAFDESKYPDLKGQWRRTNTGNPLRIGLPWDESKPVGLGQEAPLTPEYQVIYEANLADQAQGGQGIDPTYTCLSPGMPRVMIAYAPMEIVVTPETTYILMEHIHDNRRIHTDGRPFPSNMEEDPQFSGYSIGRWLDQDNDGKYDVLEVETRGLKGPRVFDASGIPLHTDNKTIVRERIYLDKANPNLLHDDITTIDNALTRPWVVAKTYRRVITDKPIWWREDVCAEGNAHVGIGKENYFLSADGLLMPSKKGQPPPDLRYFKQTRK
ncbi:MAG TPA: hypothetical protein VKP67_12280 [Xanthobacteraceae bacterium]|nr:hypothetical protein [Xanthobacteraceae bacterium]